METMEVDLFDGVKVTLPKDEALKVIAGRDAHKAQLRTAQEELGRTKAEKDAAEKKAQKEADDKAALEAAKKGEIDSVRKILTREHDDKLGKIVSKLKTDSLRAKLATAGTVLPTSVDDAAKLLESRIQFNLESQSLVALNEAGQPLMDDKGSAVDVDTFLKAWLSDRPHFLRDSTPSGTGAAKGGKGPADAQAIPRSAYRAFVQGNRPDLAALITSGKYRLTDD